MPLASGIGSWPTRKIIRGEDCGSPFARGRRIQLQPHTPAMQIRSLGSLNVSALGLGCMGMSYAYGPADQAESLHVLQRYIELGGNFLDTAEIYGPYENEKLLGRFLKDVPRDKVVVATKYGFKIDPK